MKSVDACAAVVAQTGVPFCVGFNRRFDPTHRALHDAIRGGVIDRPLRVFAPGFGAGAVGGYVVMKVDPAIAA